jgi:hypothetical protein
MRKTVIFFLLIAVLVISQTAVNVNANAESYAKVYVPLPYILATYPWITGNHIDLSAIPADRGVFSYVLYRLMYPDEQQPPQISEELKTKHGYGRFRDKRFEPVMMDYTVWAIESGYLSPIGRANHLLGVRWQDIQNLLTVLKIQPMDVEDYSIYDYEGWGFVTDSEKNTIGIFLAAFGRGIDTRSIERQRFRLTIADLICLAASLAKTNEINIDDDEMLGLTGFTFTTTQERPPSNGAILSVCYPYARNNTDTTEINDLKIWAKKEGFIYEH